MLENNSRIESENCQRSDSKERKQHDPRNRREPELRSSSLNRNRSSSLNRNRHSGEFSNYSRGIFKKWFSSFFIWLERISLKGITQIPFLKQKLSDKVKEKRLYIEWNLNNPWYDFFQSLSAWKGVQSVQFL